jgi:hypothetical protein
VCAAGDSLFKVVIPSTAFGAEYESPCSKDNAPMLMLHGDIDWIINNTNVERNRAQVETICCLG